MGNESQKSSKIERKRAQNRRFWAQSGGERDSNPRARERKLISSQVSKNELDGI